MKKIGKLTINPEKVIKNEELVNLKGGYDQAALVCKHGTTILGTLYTNNCYYPAPASQCTAVWPTTDNYYCRAW